MPDTTTTDDNTTETTEPVDNPSTTEVTPVDTTDAEQDPEVTPQETEVPDEPESQSKREARYRVQLREAEAERDQLAATVEALQRSEVERIAGKTIKQPAALWAAGVALADLLGDDGRVDTAKVESAAADARANLGLDRAWSAPVVPTEGTSIHQSTGGNTWEEAFKGGRM